MKVRLICVSVGKVELIMKLVSYCVEVVIVSVIVWMWLGNILFSSIYIIGF